MSDKQQETIKSLRLEYGMKSYSFRKAIEPIKDKLDACVKYAGYRKLTPKQVKIIKDFLGNPNG
jgi:hypothetical protein